MQGDGQKSIEENQAWLQTTSNDGFNESGFLFIYILFIYYLETSYKRQ
jgi:hypothetical protein